MSSTKFFFGGGGGGGGGQGAVLWESGVCVCGRGGGRGVSEHT